jgi:hypothetical protein
MEYTYEVNDKNVATITWTGIVDNVTITRKIGQQNFPHNGTPWTKEEAEQWAETTIQAMKDNNDTFSTLTNNLET